MNRYARLIGLFALMTVYLSGYAAEKPRVIVLTDISNEPDDEESLVRFLVYSNEYDVEGIIATTSVWLRQNPRLDLIQRDIQAYGQVRNNLLKHAQGYPAADRLMSVAKEGQTGFGMEAVGFGKSTEGSNHIVAVVDQPDERPIWISIWGGANTLAQALWDVKYARTESELKRFVSKLRVYTISDQDDAGRWLRIAYPDLYYIVTPSSVDSKEYYKAAWTGISGDRHYKNGPFEYFELVDNPWLTENVIENHGPLGALYPKLAYIMEGDTPSFLNLINNGLGSDQNPAYGGWGGRYVLHQSYAETHPIYTNSRDTVTARDGSTYTTAQATVWRWREAFQYDFAARMDWCVAKNFQDANHNPVAIINAMPGKDILELNVKPGDKVELSCEGSSDPDGDKFDTSWFVYPEAGTYSGVVELSNSQGAKTAFIAPPIKERSTIHVILQLKDHGTPPLFSYRRAIVLVEP
ncbi:MAG: nucleoside hydrolase-like domain-containing protein [Candidatus Omnitrophota bacterium]